jgi:acetyltransferase-like isoleucine patch superfamily enzyme
MDRSVAEAPFPELAITCSPGNTLSLERLSDARGRIVIKGSGNLLEILEGSLLNGSIHIQGDNNRVLIGSNCAIRGRILVNGSHQTLSVGERTTFQSVYVLCQENCNVTIGRCCMFSRNVEIRTTDAHSVLESYSGRRLNKPASVAIGDHVWLGVGALISKGVSLPDDCIVGAKAFVNDSFSESGTMIVGAPARIVKRGVTWHRSCRAEFSQDELNAWRVQPGLPHSDII